MSIMSQRLQAARRKLGLSRYQVARLLGLMEQGVRQNESGEVHVLAGDLRAYGQLYGVSEAWLRAVRLSRGKPCRSSSEMSAGDQLALRNSEWHWDTALDAEQIDERRPLLWTEGVPVPHLKPATGPNLVEPLLQQASVLARQLQHERANLEGSNPAPGRPVRKEQEQQLVQLWNAIRVARSSGGIATETVRRRTKRG